MFETYDVRTLVLDEPGDVFVLPLVHGALKLARLPGDAVEVGAQLVLGDAAVEVGGDGLGDVDAAGALGDLGEVPGPGLDEPLGVGVGVLGVGALEGGGGLEFDGGPGLGVVVGDGGVLRVPLALPDDGGDEGARVTALDGAVNVVDEGLGNGLVEDLVRDCDDGGGLGGGLGDRRGLGDGQQGRHEGCGSHDGAKNVEEGA